MKTAFAILAIVTLSCCKKKVDHYSAARDNLINKWEIRESYGGWGGRVILQPGNGFIIEFKGDDSFVRYKKDSIIQSGSYNLQSTSKKEQYRITYYMNGYDYSDDIMLKGDTLHVLAQCCDNPGYKYVKVN
jgi:hypothetical protein